MALSSSVPELLVDTVRSKHDVETAFLLAAAVVLAYFASEGMKPKDPALLELVLQEEAGKL